MRFIFFLLFIFTAPGLSAQQRFTFDHVDLTDSVFFSNGYGLPKGKFGYSGYMPAGKPAGAIVFIMNTAVLPGVGAEEKSIIKPACDTGLAVIFVSTGIPYLDFLFTEENMKTVDQLVQKAIDQQEIPRNNVLLAGLSLAGTRAMKYAEYCFLGKAANGFKPKALAMVDAPLDMLRFSNECTKAVERNVSEIAAQEGYWVNLILSDNLGGTTTEKPEAYIRYSPYCYQAKNGGNAAVLKDLPIRAYHDPDVNWWIKYRHKDFYSMNSVDAAAMVNELQLMGNTRAELVTVHLSRDEGESPHSWKIVNNAELLGWFLGLK